MADTSATTDKESSFVSDFDPNLSQKQEPDDSSEFQQDEFMETLQPVVSKLINGIRRIKRAGDRDSQKLAPLEKALNEVQVALRHLEQNVDIPEVLLEFNPHILQIVETARAQGKKPNAGLF